MEKLEVKLKRIAIQGKQKLALEFKSLEKPEVPKMANLDSNVV